MPPRTLKTFSCSIAFPAWGFVQDPSIKFMLTSFKHPLAEVMTRKTKLLMKSDWYKTVYPHVQIAPDQDQKHYFETTKMGHYYSASMSSVTGSGCDIQILDDPLNPDEALSDTVRNHTNETIRGTLFSRFNDPRTGRFILVMQRLHEDDPTGNLLQDEGWCHLKLPAQAIDGNKRIVLGGREWSMKQGDLLFPKRLTQEVLNTQRSRLLEYGYAGQYLQEPVPIGGSEFREEWVTYYDAGRANARGMNVFILVDPSGGEKTNAKKGKKSDWTAMMVVGLSPDNNYYLLDIVRDRLNPTERIDTLFLLHRKWNELTGKSPKVGYEKYGMMTDTHYIHEKMNDESYRFTLIELGGQVSKEDRIRRLIPDLQNGRWFFPTQLLYVDCEDRQFDLVRELVKCEMPTFPRARFDDMLDALSRIYDTDLMAVFPKLAQKPKKGAREAGQEDNWRDF